MKVEAHLVVPDAVEGAAWYRRAFRAVEVSRIPLPDGRCMAVELSIGDSTIHVASEFPEMGVLSPLSIGGNPTVLQIQSEDATAMWADALAAGAEIKHPLSDTFWGELHGQVADPYGNRWNIAQRLREVSPADVAAAAAKIFAPGA